MLRFTHPASSTPLAAAVAPAAPPPQRKLVQRAQPGEATPLCLLALLAALLLCSSLTSAAAVASAAATAAPSQHRLAVVMPFTQQSFATLLACVHSWAKAGPPCASATSRKTDLFLYYNRAEGPEVNALTDEFQAQSFMRGARRCFGHLGVLYAKLTDAEEGYPAGPSNMFYRLFLARRLQEQLVPYSALFWMEEDVFPVRPGWLDALHAASLDPTFWVKGSIHQSAALDEAVMDEGNWMWVGHINGNALYRLHDPGFTKLLARVRFAEPPSSYWKPFDEALWKYVHAFPHAWRLHQTAIERFVYHPFIQHYGAAICQDHIAAAKANPQTFLVHGRPGSASAVRRAEKFRDGLPVVHVPPHEWTGALPPGLRVSVFIAAGKPDLPELLLALQSIAQHLPYRLETVIVAPPRDVPAIAARLPDHLNVTLLGAADSLRDEAMQGRLAELSADDYCRGDYVLHAAPGTVFTRPALLLDLFLGGKPTVLYNRVDNLDPELREAYPGVESALGREVEFGFARDVVHVFPRALYAAAREHLEEVQARSVRDFLRGRLPNSPSWQLTARQRSALLPRLFASATAYLGAYAYYYQHDPLHWMYLNPATAREGSAGSLDWSADPGDTMIVPTLACAGDPALVRQDSGLRKEHLRLLAAAMGDPVRCGDVYNVRKTWIKCLNGTRPGWWGGRGIGERALRCIATGGKDDGRAGSGGAKRRKKAHGGQ